eukprot:scaffold14066_cov62-Phaeocystis_antarctica.AAC.4
MLRGPACGGSQHTGRCAMPRPWSACPSPSGAKADYTPRLIDLTAVVEVDLGEDLGHEGLLPTVDEFERLPALIREQQGLELADLDVAAVVRVDQGEDLGG